MKNQKFDSRAGTIDYGNSYEFLMAAYYGLRLSLNETVSDFKMSTNNNDMGNFDDVVLEIKYQDGDEHLYALQLKHRGAKDDSITLQAFDAEKGGKFGLKKYCEGYKKTEETCRNNDSYSIPFEKFHFILYTNQLLPKFHAHDKKTHKKIEADEVQLKSKVTIYKYDKCVANGLLDFSETDNYFIYKFRNNPQGMLDEKFLEQFVLYTKQKDAQEIECRISRFIYNLFNNCEPNVVTNYINFFKFWWRGDFGKFKLTKRDIMLKISEYVLTPHIPEITKFSQNGSDVLKESFAGFDLTVVEDSDNLATVQIIWDAILKEHFEKDELSLLSGIDKNFFPEGTKIPISAQGENFIEQSLRKKYIILWHMNKVPLLIKVSDNSRKGIYAAIKLCENHEKKMKFVILDKRFKEEEFSEDLKVFQNLADLVDDDVYARICTHVKVSLQGRQPIRLDQLAEIDNQFHKKISVQNLIQMLENHYVIGNDCGKNLPKHYITRFTPKILLNLSVVDEVENDIFVISCQRFTNFNFKNKTFELNKYLVMKQNASINQFSEKFHVLADDFCSEQNFRTICLLNKDKNCHHVRIVSKDNVEWIASQGSINPLRHYQIQSQDLFKKDFIEDLDVLKYFTNRINVICAEPGMGKSIMLKFLKYNCPSDLWVFSVNLNDHIKFFKEKHKIQEVLNYFLENETNDQFVKEMVMIFASKKKILFLWDGFDELPSSCVSSVVSAIKRLIADGYWQWIAARNNSREFLETAFSLFAITMTHFSEKNQQKYIYNHLKEKFEDEKKIEEMVLKLNENMSTSLNCGYFDYSGVPLQIYMVMEIFLKNPKKYLEEFKIVTLADIYQEFIEGKFMNFFERANANNNNHIMQKIQKKFKDSQLPLYEIAALKASFDEETFSSLMLDCDFFLQGIEENRDSLGLIFGLNDEKKPVFTHKTYEEFLTASWLAKNQNSFPKVLKVIFEEDYRNIRLMFDMILAKDSPVHVAVIYRNLKILENHREDISGCTDKGGRNPLQVACAWGMRHPLVTTMSETETKIIISAKETVGHSDDNVRIVKFLLAHNCQPFEKDKLAEWDSVEYSDRTLSLASIETILSFNHHVDTTKLTNFNNVNSLLYYSIKFNYQNVFQQVITSPYIELLIENNETSTLLQFAVQMDRTDFVEKLLTLPCYQEVINKPYKDLGGPIFSAVRNGNLEMFRLLQKNGARLGQNQISPLIAAVAMGHEDFCQVLLSEEQMDPNPCSADGNSILQVAALKNRINIMKLLLRYGAEVNYVSFLDVTALDYCIENRSLEGVQLLVSHGADLNRQGKTLYGYTPLHSACELGEEEIVKLLIESGTDLTIKSNRLYTPLHVALINKQEKIARMLIEADPNTINEYSEEKSTPVMLAALENFHNIIELLAKLGADLDSTQSKDSPLRIATLRNFEESVRTLIQNGASVNRPDNNGFTPLFYAISNEKILRLFLGNSATNVNAKGTRSVTPLHFAAENGRVQAMEQLLKHEANIDAKDCNNKTPLHYAVSQKHEDVVTCLLKHGARFDDGVGLLSIACLKDAPDCLLSLLNHGVDVNATDDQGRSALHFAATSSLFCVKILVRKGAEVNVCDVHGFSPLFVAVFFGKIDIISELFKAGADVTKGFGSSSALHLSAGLGDIATLLVLISADDINCRDSNGRTALHCVAEGTSGFSLSEFIKFIAICRIKFQVEPNFEGCANELLERGANVAIKNNSGLTPLVSAVLSNNVNVVKLISEKIGFRDDLVDEWQRCLFGAAIRNFTKILQILLDNNLCEINGKEQKSLMTALHYACAKNAYDCVVYLLKNGANVNAQTVDGCTPLYFGASSGNLDLVKFLVEHQAEVDTPNAHGNTSLFSAATQGFFDIVAFLCDKGANINVVDHDGDTPLHDAAAQGHAKVVEYLILKKTDVKYRNKNGKAPVDLAKDNHHNDIVEILEAYVR